MLATKTKLKPYVDLIKKKTRLEEQLRDVKAPWVTDILTKIPSAPTSVKGHGQIKKLGMTLPDNVGRYRQSYYIKLSWRVACHRIISFLLNHSS